MDRQQAVLLLTPVAVEAVATSDVLFSMTRPTYKGFIYGNK
jgi:hypothetical protein